MGHFELVYCICRWGAVLMVALHIVASNPGSLSWAERRAWYTLSAHAPKFPAILGIRILP